MLPSTARSYLAGNSDVAIWNREWHPGMLPGSPPAGGQPVDTVEQSAAVHSRPVEWPGSFPRPLDQLKGAFLIPVIKCLRDHDSAPIDQLPHPDRVSEQPFSRGYLMEKRSSGGRNCAPTHLPTRHS